MVESFLLAAATAFARFDVPIEVLAKSLLGERRDQLVTALQKEGAFTIGPFGVRGKFGCLQIDAVNNKVHVYVKTPFATSESC